MSSGPLPLPPLRRNRDFTLLWVGQLCSEVGSRISFVAYPLLVLATTGSAAQAGVVGFARVLPMLLFALPGGVLADRVDRRTLMIACDGTRALLLLSLTLAVATGHVAFLHIAVVAFVDGTGYALSYVAERGAMRQVVPVEQLPEAVARTESRNFGAVVAGPPLGGLLYGIGRAVPFAVDAASYLVSTCAMLAMRTRFQEPRGARTDSLRAEVGEGLRWVWQRPFFRVSALLAAGINPVFEGAYLLVVVRARQGGASAGAIGAMLAIVGACGVLGGVIAPPLRRRLSARAALAGANWSIVPLLPLLALTADPLLLGLVLGAAELTTPLANATVQGARIAAAPDRLQGRVQAASMLLSQLLGWLGPLAVGVGLQHAGTTATVAALTGWTLVLAVVTGASRALASGPDAAGG
jgi:MFS family permease